MSSRAIRLVLLGILVATGCDETGEGPRETLSSSTTNRFAPEEALPGAVFGGLRVVTSDLRQSEVNSNYVGSVQFAGEVTLSGIPRLIEDASPPLLCFTVDEETSGRVPRMRHDERRVWFCFDDQEEAGRVLMPRLARTVQIVVEDYRTVYEFTDAYDTAALVGIVPDSVN